MNYLRFGKRRRAPATAHPNIVPYQTFEASDGHIIVGGRQHGQFRKFWRWLRPALADDERFATNPGRVRHRAVLVPKLSALIAAQAHALLERSARGPRGCLAP